MKPIISALITVSTLSVVSQQHPGDPILVGLWFEPWKRSTSDPVSARPGDPVELDRICELAKTTRREVLDAMNLVQRAGRLGVTPVRWEEPGTASEKCRPTAFHLTIPSAAEEAAREHAPRPAPLPACTYGSVEIKRVPFGLRKAAPEKVKSRVR
jgi:hypothetical protein